MARLRSNISLIKFAAKAPPTKDAHHTRRRRFNAEKANLFSGIKQPSRFSCISSHLAPRFSKLITLSRLKPLLQKMRTTHVGGVLTPKKQTYSATLNNYLDLARTSQLVSRSLFISHLAPRTSLLEAYLSRISHLVAYNLFARNKFHAYNKP